MREALIARETWRYECLSCLHEWQDDFEAWHVDDGHGGDVVCYQHDQQPCTSPWSELVCPSCGVANAKPFPAGRSPQSPVPPQRRVEALEMLTHMRRFHPY